MPNQGAYAVDDAEQDQRHDEAPDEVCKLGQDDGANPGADDNPGKPDPLRQIHPTQFVKRGVGQNPADQQANKAKKTSTIFAVFAAVGFNQRVFAVVLLRCTIGSAAAVACSHIGIASASTTLRNLSGSALGVSTSTGTPRSLPSS